MEPWLKSVLIPTLSTTFSCRYWIISVADGEFRSTVLRMLEMSEHSRISTDGCDEWQKFLTSSDDSKFFAETLEMRDLAHHQIQEKASQHRDAQIDKDYVQHPDPEHFSTFSPQFYATIVVMSTLSNPLFTKSDSRATTYGIYVYPSLWNLSFAKASCCMYFANSAPNLQ